MFAAITSECTQKAGHHTVMVNISGTGEAVSPPARSLRVSVLASEQWEERDAALSKKLKATQHASTQARGAQNTTRYLRIICQAIEAGFEDKYTTKEMRDKSARRYTTFQRGRVKHPNGWGSPRNWGVHKGNRTGPLARVSGHHSCLGRQ